MVTGYLILDNNKSTINQTDLKINRDGHITTPNKTNVSLRNVQVTTIIINTSPVPFPTVVYNVGSHYNNSNYTFTAPLLENIFMHLFHYLNGGVYREKIYPRRFQ